MSTNPELLDRSKNLHEMTLGAVLREYGSARVPLNQSTSHLPVQALDSYVLRFEGELDVDTKGSFPVISSLQGPGPAHLNYLRHVPSRASGSPLNVLEFAPARVVLGYGTTPVLGVNWDGVPPVFIGGTRGSGNVCIPLAQATWDRIVPLVDGRSAFDREVNTLLRSGDSSTNPETSRYLVNLRGFLR